MTNTTGSPEHDDAATPAAEVEPTAPESPSAADPAPTTEAAETPAAAPTPADLAASPVPPAADAAAGGELASDPSAPAETVAEAAASAEVASEAAPAAPEPGPATGTEVASTDESTEAAPAAPVADPGATPAVDTDVAPAVSSSDDSADDRAPADAAAEPASPAAVPSPADLAAATVPPADDAQAEDDVASSDPAPEADAPASEAAEAAPATPEPGPAADTEVASTEATADADPGTTPEPDASADEAAEATPATPEPDAESAPAPSAPVATPTPADLAAAVPAADAGTPAEPTPTPTPTPAPPTPASESGEDASTVASNEWGRVDETGEVFVRTPEGERSIGSWQVGQPAEALAFFIRKYEDLAVQVDLLETRLESGAAAPDDTAQGVAKVRTQLAEAHAIGDLAALAGRLDALEARIAERRAERRAARARALDEARGRKEQIASQAETIAEGNDWRNGADILRGLLDEWKSLPRLDRSTDDELWRRFSSARTHYTRRRKAHFSELAERRDEARVIKERILAEAEEICQSTDWGPTSRRYRELMSEWKAAGPAPRGVEDSLWKRFRAAQDTFFGARSAHQSQRDDEQQANLAAKEGILAQAEALLPITDWKAARQQLRGLQERWEEAGHVPRDAMRSVEGRMRRVEDAIREAEQNEWQRSNPEARARAQATVTQLEASIAGLEQQAEKARTAGNERKLREAEEAIAARKSWLEQAQQALEEFTG